MQFEIDVDGFAIGYHCEGCETFAYSGAIPLSMDTLDNSRTLFISPNPNSWSNHTDRVLKIKFNIAKQFPLFTDFRSKAEDQYTQLLKYSTNPNRYTIAPNSILAGHIADGYNLFCLDDPKEELPEAFLVNPKQHVVSIEVM